MSEPLCSVANQMFQILLIYASLIFESLADVFTVIYLCNLLSWLSDLTMAVKREGRQAVLLPHDWGQ